jgi:hypothetical protein
MLDARLRDMPNAFSIVTPAITDSFVTTLSGMKMKHMTSWGMSSQSKSTLEHNTETDIKSP